MLPGRLSTILPSRTVRPENNPLPLIIPVRSTIDVFKLRYCTLEWSKLEWPPSFQFIGIDKISVFIRRRH